jgi:hypothetical protein
MGGRLKDISVLNKLEAEHRKKYYNYSNYNIFNYFSLSLAV